MKNSSHKQQNRVSRKNQAFQTLTLLNQKTVHILFPGRFCNKNITWDASLITLEECSRHLLDEKTVLPNNTIDLQQFIEIGPETGQGRLLTVALNVQRIDEPTMLKTIIMIHNYKKLRLGRHVFGQIYQYP